MESVKPPCFLSHTCYMVFAYAAAWLHKRISVLNSFGCVKAPCPSEMNISWLPFSLCGLSGRHWLEMQMAAGEMDLLLSKSHWANSIDLFSPFCLRRIRLAEQPELLCWSRNLSEPTAWGGHRPGFWRVIADEVVLLKDGFFIFVCVLSVAGFEKRS